MNNKELEFADLRTVYDQSVPGHFATDDYVFFWAGPFSNWHPTPFVMPRPEGGGCLEFNCSEQALMYFKAVFFDDEETARKIMNATEPGLQKKLGRSVKNYVESSWASVREDIMYEILLRKFYQVDEVREALSKTGNKTIVEASPYDKVWGIGMGVDKHPQILDPNNWRGDNLLGKAIMRVRDYIHHNVYDLYTEQQSCLINVEIDKAIIAELVKMAKEMTND